LARSRWACSTFISRCAASVFLLPSASLSPLDTVAGIEPGTRILVVAGASDEITLPDYAKTYVRAARSRGLDAELVVLPDRGHDILDEPEVVDLAASRIAELMA
jgi:pimeloyl-ACP methyl ester carboxylesterase